MGDPNQSSVCVCKKSPRQDRRAGRQREGGGGNSVEGWGGGAPGSAGLPCPPRLQEAREQARGGGGGGGPTRFQGRRKAPALKSDKGRSREGGGAKQRGVQRGSIRGENGRGERALENNGRMRVREVVAVLCPEEEGARARHKKEKQ